MRHVDVDEVRRILDETPSASAPSAWTGAYVGERMIDAFRVLDRLPERIYPQEYRAAVAFLSEPGREFADAVAAEGIRDKRTFSWGRIRPPAAEISRMERAFAWPARYLGDSLLARESLFAWAQARTRNSSPHWFLARHRLTSASFADLRRRACYQIAVSLQRDQVRVD